MNTTQLCEISMSIPDHVKVILKIFNEKGYKISCVGGCVRDVLLDRTVNDWDLCTSAKPDEMIALCEENGLRYVETGIKHGTITIFSGTEGYEVTAYRMEGIYSDGRHPDQVIFTDSIALDLARRDFTINAMAYNDMDGLIDCFHGMEDLRNKQIRCVGNPKERFREDNLRRLRAVRFAVQLGFSIEVETGIALQQETEGMALLSKERVRDELFKILVSDEAAMGIHYLSEFGMLPYVLGDFVASTVDLSLMAKRVENVPTSIEVRLAAVATDLYLEKLEQVNSRQEGAVDSSKSGMGALMCVRNSLKKCKIANRTIEAVLGILSVFWLYHPDMNRVELKHMMIRVGKRYIIDALDLVEAHYHTTACECDKIEKVVDARKECVSIIERGDPLVLGDLEVNGKILMELGISDGVTIGKALDAAMETVLENPSLNTKDLLSSMIKDKFLNGRYKIY